jgi:hypothetical protein
MATRRVLVSVGRRLLGGDSAVALEGVGGLTSVHTREMSSRGSRGRFRGARRPVGKAAPPPTMEDTWEEVKDETTGQTYWWNVQTNETTALGAPKPVATSLTPAQQGGAPPPVGQPPQQRSMMGAFGSMVAEGMAFGTGSAIAHRAIGSMFGGGGYGYGGGMGGGGGAAPPEPGSGPEVPSEGAGGSSMWGDEFDADSDSSEGGGWGDVFDGWDE